MPPTKTRIDEVSGAIFLIGLGCLFYVGFWPGILFLVAAIMIVRGIVARRPWDTFQAAAWVIGVGIWAMLDWSVGALLIVIGVVMLIPVMFRAPSIFRTVRPFSTAKPKVDDYLD